MLAPIPATKIESIEEQCKKRIIELLRSEEAREAHVSKIIGADQFPARSIADWLEERLKYQ